MLKLKDDESRNGHKVGFEGGRLSYIYVILVVIILRSSMAALSASPCPPPAHTPKTFAAICGAHYGPSTGLVSMVPVLEAVETWFNAVGQG